MMSFKVKPEPPLSAEHARHYERFTGVPYDPEQLARDEAWGKFKKWHHEQQVKKQSTNR